MSKEFQTLLDKLVIEDVETLKVIAHPKRLEMLRTLDKPRTVSEIAEMIDEDATRLYYHVRLMEKAGLIQVVDTNVVSGIIEKTYQVVAKQFVAADDVIGDERGDVLMPLIDNARAMLKKSLDANVIDGNSTKATLTSGYFKLTAKQIIEVSQRLDALINDLHALDDTDDAEEGEQTDYILTVVFHPLSKN